MVKRFLNRLMTPASVAALLFITVLSSCIRNEYDLTNVDTTVSVGGEALVFPVGNTGQLKLKTLLSEEDFEYITEFDGGVYGFSMKDEMVFTDEIPDLGSSLKIDPVRVAENFEFSVDDVDFDSMTLEQQTFSNKVTFDGVSNPDVTLPDVNETRSIETGIYEYYPSEEQLDMSFPDQKFEFEGLFNPSDASSIPGYDQIPGDQDIDVSGLFPQCNLPEKGLDVNVKVELADGVSNIDDIILDENASMVVSLSLVNSFLTGGSVVPDITVDVSQLIGIGGNGGIVSLGNDFELNQANSFNATKSYTIESLAVDPEDWNGNLLEKAAKIGVSGSISLSGAYANKNSLNASMENGGMGVNVLVTFTDVKVKDVSMDIAPVNKSENVAVNLDIAPITLPEQVTGVRDIKMTPDSRIVIDLSSSNLVQMTGVKAALDEMKISFPKEIVSPDLNSDNQLIVKDVDLKEGGQYVVNVTSIVPSEPVDGVISFDNSITADISATFNGNVRLSQLPQTASEDPLVNTAVRTDLNIEEYYLYVDNVEQEMVQEPYDIKFDLPEGTGDIGTFIVHPETYPEQPKVVVDINMPEFAELDVKAGAEGIKITFPELLSFKNVNPEYNYSKEDNSITIYGEIPPQISLDIDYLTITPQQDAEGTGYYANGQLIFEGTAIIGSDNGTGVISGTEAEQLVNSGVEVTSVISAMTAESVSLEEFETLINRNVSFDLLDFNDIPAEVASMNEIELADAELNLTISVENLPDMGNPAILDINVKMPEELVIEDSRLDEDNVLHIVETLGSEPVILEPVKISKVDMSNINLESEGKLSMEMLVDGRVYVTNPNVRPEDLNGLVMSVNVNADIESIDIARITGIVDYKFENMSQSVALDNLPEFLKGEDVRLDFTRPHIALSVTGNVGIPVKGEIEIVPYVNGAAGTTVNVENLVIPASSSSSETITTNYWIADAPDGKPGDYIFLQADIRSLLSRIPDKLDLRINAGSDTQSTELHVVEPSATYTMKMDYDFSVPLEFGEDLNISMSNTMEDMPSVLGQLLNMNTLSLGGEIESSLPLEMRLNLELLDSNGKVIELAEEASQNISACNSDGSAAVTPLDLQLALKQGVDASDFKSIRMTFTVTCPNTSGIPVTNESYLQAKLNVRVPGGLTIDLSELGTPVEE